MTAEPGAHKWEFKARFRQHAFGWKSQRAIQRIKQAVSEIKKVARTDPVLADSQILVAALTPAKTKVGDARRRTSLPEISCRKVDGCGSPAAAETCSIPRT